MKIMVLICIPMMVFGLDSISALDGDVTVRVNGALKTLKKNTVIELDECDTVSFVNGSGKLKVKNFVFSEQTLNKSYKTVCKENYFSQLAGQLFASTESSKPGVSLREVKIIKSTPEYHVKKPVDNETVYEKYFYFSKDHLVVNMHMFSAKKLLFKIHSSDKKVHILDLDKTTESAIKIDASIIEKKCIFMEENAETNDKLLSIYID